jgi:adenylate cyclase, class 2
MREVEVKAKLRNKDEVIKKLEALGCKFSKPITQKDTIFALPGTTFPADIGVIILRVRQQNGKYILTLKSRQSTGLDKLEREVTVPDPKSASDFCEALGYKKHMTFSKIRLKTNYKGNEICIDEVEGLGTYIEMEEMTEEGSSEEIQNRLFEFLKTLGINDSDQEHYGYDVLIYQKTHGA